jgi:hypothetical protein
MDTGDYTISDMNKTNPVTDVVKIKSIHLTQPNVIDFELEGVTKQDLEFYRIDLKGIKDMAGNIIVPNPKSITAVQRFSAKTSQDTAQGATFNIKSAELLPAASAENTEKPAL